MFANPSFLEGMARVLDLGGSLQEYNRSETDAMADALAMQEDWRMTGKDIKAAIDTYAIGWF